MIKGYWLLLAIFHQTYRQERHASQTAQGIGLSANSGNGRPQRQRERQIWRRTRWVEVVSVFLLPRPPLLPSAQSNRQKAHLVAELCSINFWSLVCCLKFFFPSFIFNYKSVRRLASILLLENQIIHWLRVIFWFTRARGSPTCRWAWWQPGSFRRHELQGAPCRCHWHCFEHHLDQSNLFWPELIPSLYNWLQRCQISGYRQSCKI